MKRNAALLLALVFVLGCGSQKAEEKQRFEGVTEKKDFVAIGKDFLSKQDVPNAIKSFDQAIKQDPRNIDNYIVLGEVYLRLKAYPQAVDTLKAGLRIDPNSGMTYYLMATALAFAGEMEEAVISAKKSAAIYQVYLEWVRK